MKNQKNHAERAHSKFSASGAERWFNCSASVELSEGLPDKSSPWAEEGTKAHEVLEQLMLFEMRKNTPQQMIEFNDYLRKIPRDMFSHGMHAANFILAVGQKLKAEVVVENRVYLDFIHPEMFGTYDGAVLDHFGTLHVFDYKYGAGYSVSPVENLQMIFYGIGLAHQFDWNFKKVRLWIIQPRIKGYEGPLFWEISIEALRRYVLQFERAVDVVLNNPAHREGHWCHWCKAKSICPLKQEAKLDKARLLFSPIGKVNTDGKKEGRQKEGRQKEVYEETFNQELDKESGQKESEEDFF